PFELGTQHRAMATRLVLAEAADRDGRCAGECGEEVDDVAGRRLFQFPAIRVEEAAADLWIVEARLADRSQQLRAGRNDGKPDVEVVVFLPAAARHPARRKARRPETEPFPTLWRVADPEGVDFSLAGFQLTFHSALFSTVTSRNGRSPGDDARQERWDRNKLVAVLSNAPATLPERSRKRSDPCQRHAEYSTADVNVLGTEPDRPTGVVDRPARLAEVPLTRSDP